MLELPGLIGGENPKEDIEALRRYLGRLIPELEQQLINAQQDSYQDELNKRINQVTGVNNGTTAGALAEHVRDFSNPHRVTLAQLGFSLGKFLSLERAGNGAVIRIGEKRGLQINFQHVLTNITEWTQNGGTGKAEQALGDWSREIPELMAAMPILLGEGQAGVWAGALKGATGESMGTLEVFTDLSVDTSEGASNSGTKSKTVNFEVIAVGLGVFGYGDN